MHLSQRSHRHSHPSRRDFFRTVMGSALAGASILELAQYRAAWAQAGASIANADLFNIEKVADDVYFARAKPTAILNCNAGIFVNSRDVLVVDAHSKPSAAASLIAQIKKEITRKPVRYLVDTHFHWDHSQGNAAYAANGAKVLASKDDTSAHDRELRVAAARVARSKRAWVSRAAASTGAHQCRARTLSKSHLGGG